MAGYDTRLATRISASVNHRLRLQALVTRQRLSQLIDDLLDEALPSSDELVARLRQEAGDAR